MPNWCENTLLIKGKKNKSSTLTKDIFPTESFLLKTSFPLHKL